MQLWNDFSQTTQYKEQQLLLVRILAKVSKTKYLWRFLLVGQKNQQAFGIWVPFPFPKKTHETDPHMVQNAIPVIPGSCEGSLQA